MAKKKSKDEIKQHKKKKSKRFYKILSFLLVVLSVAAGGILIYFNIIPLKYLVPGLVLLTLIVFFIAFKLNKRTCLFTKLVCSLFSIIIMACEVMGIIYALGTLDFLNDIIDTGLRTEIYNVYVLEDSDYTKLDDLNGKNIATYKSDSSNLSKAEEKLKHKINYKNVVKESLYEGVDSVINKENDALFVSDSMMEIYNEDHENGKKLRVLDSIDVLTKAKSIFKSVNVANKPFVVYLSGVDSSGTISKQSRSDVNILAFVNPDAGKIFLLNTPRDYYVTLASKHAKDKLTHAGIYGIEESANTLGLLYGTTVNYYARVNFTSFVNIINTLGGITVNVETPDYRYNDGIYCGSNTVCEQNSKRAFGSNMVYVKAGLQTLNGEQALAYSRNRHQYDGGDNARQLHQQQVLKGIIDKASSPAILAKYNSLLKSLSKGVLTNIEQKTITTLVNKQLDDNTKWTVENYTVKGTDSYNTTYSTGSAKAYVMVPDMNTVNEAKLKIKTIMES